MKKLLMFFSLLLVSTWTIAQCECINELNNAIFNANVMIPNVSGNFINRYTGNYWLDLEDGKSYRIIMRHQSGDYICSNPNMEVQNVNAGSNNYTYDFVYDASNWTVFAFSWVYYSGVHPGQSESFEFEVRKKILGIYYEQHTFNLTVNATCVESWSNPPSQNLAHGLADYEVNDFISVSSAVSNYYSDGTMNFDAGNYVNFGPGFSTSGGTYEAFIDGCNGLKSLSPENGSTSENNSSDILGSELSEVQLYPNPVEDYVTLVFGNLERRTISIIDESGRVLNNYEVKEADNIQIDLSDLIDGIYFVKITSINGISEVKKILKK
jgi:hypothetical protein